MFIELTDHLRCPRDHEEAYLVLLPEVVDQRDVRSGRLGCPVCQWETTFTDGVVDFGGGKPAVQPSGLSVDAVRAFLGVSGPGGYIALVGSPASLAPELAQAFRGVSLVLVNPPEGTVALPPSSVLLAARVPLKSPTKYGVSGVAAMRLATSWYPKPRSQRIVPSRTTAADIAGMAAC